MSKSFKTPSGVELPLMQLKGKDYLQVAHRLVWFREVHPDWTIETEFILNTENIAQAKATVRDAEGRIRGTGHKVETPKGFADYHEKSETGAIGRALAHCGFGTQFAPEMLEGDAEGPKQRIVDAPVDPLKNHAPAAEAKPIVDAAALLDFDPGDYKCTFGKYTGMTVREIDAIDINKLGGLIDFLKEKAAEKKLPLSKSHQALVDHGEAYLQLKNNRGAK